MLAPESTGDSALVTDVMSHVRAAMPEEVAAWKAQQRVAMGQQLQLEEESLARLEAAAAANGGGASGLNGAAADDGEDDSVFDAPGFIKVGHSGPEPLLPLLDGGCATAQHHAAQRAPCHVTAVSNRQCFVPRRTSTGTPYALRRCWLGSLSSALLCHV